MRFQMSVDLNGTRVRTIRSASRTDRPYGPSPRLRLQFECPRRPLVRTTEFCTVLSNSSPADFTRPSGRRDESGRTPPDLSRSPRPPRGPPPAPRRAGDDVSRLADLGRRVRRAGREAEAGEQRPAGRPGRRPRSRPAGLEAQLAQDRPERLGLVARPLDHRRDPQLGRPAVDARGRPAREDRHPPARLPPEGDRRCRRGRGSASSRRPRSSMAITPSVRTPSTSSDQQLDRPRSGRRARRASAIGIGRHSSISAGTRPIRSVRSIRPTRRPPRSTTGSSLIFRAFIASTASATVAPDDDLDRVGAS